MRKLINLKRVRRRLGLGARPGTEPLVIDHLLSPLRYDIVVRQQFFEFLAGRPGRNRSDDPSFLADAMAQPYFAWFTTLVIGPDNEKLPKGQTVTEAYGAQIDRVAAMFETWDRAGTSLGSPLLMRQLPDGIETTTGKRLAARPFPVDGGHRLALLRLSGHRELPAGAYHEVSDSWPPRDNTLVLLKVSPIRQPDYVRFLSSGYLDEPVDDADVLLRKLRAQRPSLEAEVTRILAIDRPFLTG